jgi:hypothetical protein
MKRFDYEKVKNIAIDLPKHQQIYVLDDKNRTYVISLLNEMGFTSDSKSLSLVYSHLPWVLNVEEKRFFNVGSISVIACAIQQGAKVLKLDQLIELIHNDVT